MLQHHLCRVVTERKNGDPLRALDTINAIHALSGVPAGMASCVTRLHADILIDLGLYEEARVPLDALKKNDPSCAATLLRLALVNNALGDYDGAMQHITTAEVFYRGGEAPKLLVWQRIVACLGLLRINDAVAAFAEIRGDAGATCSEDGGKPKPNPWFAHALWHRDMMLRGDLTVLKAQTSALDCASLDVALELRAALFNSMGLFEHANKDMTESIRLTFCK
jgi:tetratricopeptide (TPR) repeat protein